MEPISLTRVEEARQLCLAQDWKWCPRSGPSRDPPAIAAVCWSYCSGFLQPQQYKYSGSMLAYTVLPVPQYYDWQLGATQRHIMCLCDHPPPLMLLCIIFSSERSWWICSIFFTCHAMLVWNVTLLQCHNVNENIFKKSFQIWFWLFFLKGHF
jgi:hypothetical protein